MIFTRDFPGLDNFLPFHSYDSREKVFIQKDGSLSVLMRLSFLETELLDMEEVASIAGTLSSIIRICPEGTRCQFIFVNSLNPDVRIGANDGSHELVKKMAEYREDYLRTLALNDGVITYRSRERVLYLTLTIKPDWETLNLNGIIDFCSARKADLRVEKFYKSSLQRLSEVAGAVKESFQQAGVRPEICDNEGFSRLMKRFLPSSSIGIKSIDNEVLVRSGGSSLSFDYLSGTICIDGSNYSLISISELPRVTFAGMMNKCTKLWAGVNNTIFVIGVSLASQKEVMRFLNVKRKLCFWQGNSKSSKVEVDSIAGEVDDVMQEIFKEGEKVVSVRMNFIASNEKEDDVKPSVSNIMSNLYRMGFESVRESSLALTMFLQALPFGFSEENEPFLKRSKKMTTHNLSHLIPVYGLMQGGDRDDLILTNRDGQIVKFSFFDSDVAPHGIIAGVSGAGKSVWSNNLVLSVLRRNARVFIIDRGNSYKKLTRMLGGEYVELNPVQPICINPFGSSLDNEKHIFLTHLVAEMCTYGDDRVKPRDLNLISKSISIAFDRANGEEVRISDVKSVMDELGLEELSACLELYTGSGPYADFFDGRSDIKVDGKSLVVFELGELGLLKEIAGVVLMSIIHSISKECMSGLDTDKYLLIDEAWTLLKTENTARFLENVYRTYRKYRTSAIIITQQITDFTGPIAMSIRSNAPNRILLRQIPDTISMMTEELGFSPPVTKMLETLNTSKGLYSEALVISDRTKGVVRLTLDKFSYLLMTSDPAENTRLRLLVDKYKMEGSEDPTLEAINELSFAT